MFICLSGFLSLARIDRGGEFSLNLRDGQHLVLPVATRDTLGSNMTLLFSWVSYE